MRANARASWSLIRPSCSSICRVRHCSSCLHPRACRCFQQTRLFTEVALAREACRWTSGEELKRLEQLLRENEATADNKEAFASTDDAFHFGIASLANNPLIIALYRSVLTVLQDQRHTSLQHDDALGAAIGCHARIFDAIAARMPIVPSGRCANI